MEANSKSLQQVRDKVASAHKDCSTDQKLQFYNQWASQYEEVINAMIYMKTIVNLALAMIMSGCPHKHIFCKPIACVGSHIVYYGQQTYRRNRG